MIHKAAGWVETCITVRRGAKRRKDNGEGCGEGKTRQRADGETTFPFLAPSSYVESLWRRAAG